MEAGARGRLGVALAAVLLVGMIPVSVSAGGFCTYPCWPVLHSGSSEEASWAVVPVTTDGSGFRVSVRPDPVGDLMDHRYHVEARVFDDQGQLLSRDGVTDLAPRDGAAVRTDTAPGLDIASWGSIQTWGCAGDCVQQARLRLGSPDAGAYTLVVWVAGDVHGWSYVVGGEAGVDVGDPSTGDGTSLFTREDMRGAGAIVSVSGVGIGAHVDAEKAVEIDGTLLGSYAHANDGAFTTFRVQGPDGAWECPCVFGDFGGPDHAGPGTYTFQATGVEEGSYRGSDLVISVADLPNPVP